jgi:hypothetical protein
VTKTLEITIGSNRSFAGLAFVVAWGMVALYLVVHPHKANGVEICLEAGHHDCGALVNP